MKIRYITEQIELQRMVQALRHSAVRIISCDCETLGLNPRKDRLRLLSLAYSEDRVFVIDCFKVDITPLFPILENKILVFHNGLFDLQFLWMLGFRPGQVRDTMLMSQVRYAGRKTDEGKRLSHSLEAVLKRELNITLSKNLQTSDWSGNLTREQIEYSGRDAALLLPIYEIMRQKAVTFGLEKAVEIENRALLALVWMSVQGVPVDVRRWEKLTEKAQGEVCALEEVLCSIIVADLGEGRVVNWASPKQVKALFEELGNPLASTARSYLAESDHRVAKVLLAYREVMKLTTTYGMKWIGKAVNSRQYIGWIQNTTYTGRMAASTPNLQQVPRKKEYRSCIQAPKGGKLICADFCLVPETLILTKDLRWVPAGSLKEGDTLVGIEENRTSKTKHGYSKPRVMLPSTVEHVGKRVAYCTEITLEDGRQIVCTKEHPWLRWGPHGYEWVNTEDLTVGSILGHFLYPWQEDLSKEAGWLAGVYDGEGSVSHGKGSSLVFTQREGAIYDKVRELLKIKGYPFQGPYTKSGGYPGSNSDVKMLWITSIPWIFYFLGKIRPVRLLRNVEKAWIGRRAPMQCPDGGSVIKGLRKVGFKEVISIQTDTHTFVANGLWSHNSQIEVRIVAKLANESRMIAIFQSGGDIHTATAKLILGKEEVTKEDRQVAKSAVFALLYGAGAPRFQQYAKTNYGVEMSLDEAKQIREKFFHAYPKLARWHRSHGDKPINTRTLIGRWRCGVEKFTEKQNSPSQGSGADMMKLALALMWERRAEGGGYAPIAAIHDEILAEGPEETAEQAKEWVIRCMVDASSFMLWPVPTGVEASICDSWGEKG